MHGLRTKIFQKTTAEIKKNQENMKKILNDIHGTFKNAKENLDINLSKAKEKLDINLSKETKESMKEVAYATAGLATCGAVGHYYTQNPDILDEKNIQKYMNNLIEPTISAKFLTQPLAESHKDISRAIKNISDFQSGVSFVRSWTSKLSPAFTIVPVLAQPAFATSTTLSMGDVFIMMRLSRIKKMIDLRPDIIPDDKKEEYNTRMSHIDKHISKEILFDLTKFFYRAQIVAVNRKLRENEKPQKVYANSCFKKLSVERLIPLKNNLNIVGVTLPVSYLISKLSAEDTRLFKNELTEFTHFMQNIHLDNQDTAKDSAKDSGNK